MHVPYGFVYLGDFLPDVLRPTVNLKAGLNMASRRCRTLHHVQVVQMEKLQAAATKWGMNILSHARRDIHYARQITELGQVECVKKGFVWVMGESIAGFRIIMMPSDAQSHPM
jgi:hypothetical protein